jgi:predicted nucleotidyltransferase
MLHDYKISNLEIPELAQTIADKFSIWPQVTAVVLAGSRTIRQAEELSDFDLYLYVDRELHADIREKIAIEMSDRYEIDNQFWEPGDELIDRETGCGIDIMYREPEWIEVQLDRLLLEHQASVGYSTCFWWNVLTSEILYDRDGWFQKLQETADRPYPEPLRQAIIAKNHPILRDNLSSFYHQLASAISRQDSISIVHRTAALLGSYFDIIFAVNCIPHPGEKRLVELAKNLCSKLPKDFEWQIESVTNRVSLLGGDRSILSATDKLIDGLDELLIQENLITPQLSA